MLIRLEELVRVAGTFERAIPLAINPLLIDAVRPEDLPGHEGMSCRLELQGDDSPTFVSGTLDNVLGVIQGADETAVEKLQWIGEIATGEPQVRHA